MASLPISGLPAVVTPVGADELAINQSGTTKKMTITQLLGLATSGTGTANQVAYWTGASTLGGDAGFIMNGSTLAFNKALSSFIAFDMGEGSATETTSLRVQHASTGSSSRTAIFGNITSSHAFDNTSGYFQAGGSSTNNFGVQGISITASAGTNTAGYFQAAAGASNYALRLTDGSEGTATHVWTSQDANGNGNWAAIPSQLSYGLENEIPVTNSATNDYDYSSNFKYDGTRLNVDNGGIVINAAGALGTDEFLQGWGTGQVGYDKDDITLVEDSSRTRYATARFLNTIGTLNDGDYSMIELHVGNTGSTKNCQGFIGVKKNSSGTHTTDMFFGTRTAGTTATARVKEGLLITHDQKVKISDAYTMPSADGTVGQVIGTDGAGVLSFTTAAAGGGEFTLDAQNNLFGGDLAGDELDGTGASNFFAGDQCGRYVTSGDENVYMGGGAGKGHSTTKATGNKNIGVGAQALTAITSAFNNVAIGYGSLLTMTSGSDVVAIGKDAGQVITTGNRSAYIGSRAGLAETTGIFNTFIGYGAGEACVNTDYNCVIGQSLHPGISGGDNNVLIGHRASTTLTSGADNIIIRPNELNTATTLTTGSQNTIIGFNATDPAAATSNYVTLDDIYRGDSSAMECYMACPSTAAADADLNNNEVHLYLDEAGNNLKFKVKDSTAAVKIGTLAVA